MSKLFILRYSHTVRETDKGRRGTGRGRRGTGRKRRGPDRDGQRERNRENARDREHLLHTVLLG